jgi:dCTP deaminase
MTVLSSNQIKDRVFVENPREPKRIFIIPTPKRSEIKDASIDLILGNYFIVTKTAKFSMLDASEKISEKNINSYQEKVFIPFDGSLVLHPGTFVLGVTWQYLGLPSNIYGQVFSRSTWGRAGLTVATAVSIHPGFCGCLTLELVNNGNAPLALHPGSRIAQVVFFDTGNEEDEPVTSVSMYCGMTEPDFSKLHKEFDELKNWEKIGKRTSFKDIK